MGKKSLKKQSNATNIGHTVTAETTSQSASTLPVNTNAPETTQLSFFHFITIATTENITEFLEFAATTPDRENLQYLWERTYEDGFEKGRKSLLQSLGRKMEEKFEEGVKKGMDLGCEEGYMVAKESFDNIIREVEAREAPKVDTSNAESQTDPPATTTTSVSTQTKPTTVSTTSQAQTLVKNTVGACSAPTSAVSIQTDALIVTVPLIVFESPVFCLFWQICSWHIAIYFLH